MCKFRKRYCNGSEWMSECNNNICQYYGKECALDNLEPCNDKIDEEDRD